MTRFIVTNTIACYVTWRYDIEAESAEHARELYIEGNWIEEDGPEIGNAIECIDQEITVTEDTEAADASAQS